MAAASASANANAKTILLERDEEVGGVLNQCIHTGFGLHRYHEELSGPEFGDRLTRELYAANASVITKCSVIKIDPNGPRAEALSPSGRLAIRARAIVWASGARERPYGSLMVPGPRPAGIYTAGLAQRLVNIHGYLPGKRALILGSGDIGLIMARRLYLEGMDVVAVVELQPTPGGLTRNVIQCLEDYNIPLLLSHTVIKVEGNERLNSVTIARVDKSGNAVAGSEKRFEVDTLILSVGLIPENDLIVPFALVDAVNRGPVVNSLMQTTSPWLFAAGNNVAIFDLVDSVADVGEVAGRSAALYSQGELQKQQETRLIRGENVASLVPISLSYAEDAKLYLRCSRPMDKASIEIGDAISRKLPVVRPSEMIEIHLPQAKLTQLMKNNEAKVEVKQW
jgi:NADPH-dependent 2,4-dienoyl-CoA reductase/sulfur reductase-like enzyme